MDFGNLLDWKRGAEMSEQYAAYCGLYCGHCYSRTHIAPTAAALKGQMVKQGFESFGPYMPDWQEFWRFLNTLVDAEGCPGCRSGGGSPGCEMRICARERGLAACPLCEEYPCSRFGWLKDMNRYPMLEADNLYMKEHGFEAWLEMQDERREKGFTYVDEREKYRKQGG